MAIAVALASLGLLAYTYVGYPVLIGLLARLSPRRRPRQSLDGDSPPAVTVFLPVSNGAAFLESKVRSLLEQDYPPEKLDVIVYSDGSTDDTEAIARRLASQAPGRVTLIAAETRAGKPTALNRMREIARGELLLLTDVRQPFSPGAVRALAESFQDPSVGCATGALVLRGGATSGVYWRYEKWIRRQESRFRSVVGMTGCIAMVRAADLDPLPEDVILDDVWIPMKLRLRGKSVLLCDEAEAYDDAFEDDREFKRKVRTLAGNYQLFARMPALLVPFVNPSWFETISHKVTRLMAPWALGALLVSSAVAASAGGRWDAVMATLFVGQLLFYAGALVGARAGKMTAVARTFVVLNLAAVVGLWRHVAGRQRITW